MPTGSHDAPTPLELQVVLGAMSMIGAGAAEEADSDHALIAAARAGSAAAAGTVISRYAPYLLARARSIASGTRLDPEDLLSAAIVRLLELWRAGEGPDGGVAAYVVRAMTNSAIDASRSPRSRVLSLEAAIDASPAEELALAREDSNVRRIDLYQEFRIIRLALATLDQDHQAVLTEIVIHGRKPGDVAAELGRSPAAVSRELYRAKQGLRRAVLVQLLDEGDAECRANAPSIPLAVQLDPGDHRADDRGMRHVLECEACRRNWRRFAGLVGGLGLLPAAVLAQAVGTPSAASASTGGDAPSSRPDSEPSSAPIASAPASGTSAAGAPAAGAPVGPAPPAAGTPSAIGPSGRSAAPAVGAGRVAARLASRRVLVAGAVALAAAAVVGAAALLVPAHEQPGFAAGGQVPVVLAPEADFTASVAPGSIDLAFDVPGEDWWRFESVGLVLPEGVRLVAVPAGWTCDGGGPWTCAVAEDRPTGGRLRLAAADGSTLDGRPFGLGIRAITDGGVRVDASAEGYLR